MENSKKILNLLGLATKAGKIASGEFAAEKAVKSGKAHLVIISEEASDKVPIYFFGKKEELGHAMGKEMRASLALLDAGFSKALVKQMELNGGSEYES